jgi:hypothetical protein
VLTAPDNSNDGTLCSEIQTICSTATVNIDPSPGYSPAMGFFCGILTGLTRRARLWKAFFAARLRT